jgi:hypothetical protein
MSKPIDIKFSPSSSLDDFYSSPKDQKVLPSRIRVASTQDLNGFMKVSSDKLVHVSQQDFWKLAKDEETGEYFIERLAEEYDIPVKG